MIGRTACLGRLRMRKTQFLEIQALDIDIDNPGGDTFNRFNGFLPESLTSDWQFQSRPMFLERIQPRAGASYYSWLPDKPVHGKQNPPVRNYLFFNWHVASEKRPP